MNLPSSLDTSESPVLWSTFLVNASVIQSQLIEDDSQWHQTNRITDVSLAIPKKEEFLIE